MKIEATLADPLFIAGSIYSASQGSNWWLVVIPLVVASWFINPRWNKQDGWRFLHDE